MHLFNFLLSIVTTVKNSGTSILPLLSVASLVAGSGLLAARTSRKKLRSMWKQRRKRSRSIGSRLLTIFLVAGSILLFITLLSKSTAAALIFILVLVLVMSLIVGLKT